MNDVEVTDQQEHNFIILRAVVDGVVFASDQYEGDLSAWMKAILDARTAPAVDALRHLAKYGKQCDVRFIAGEALAKMGA